ncbi:MAG: hypothetical protein R3C05_24510 [Pirellulaceae bacterium]
MPQRVRSLTSSEARRMKTLQQVNALIDKQEWNSAADLLHEAENDFWKDLLWIPVTQRSKPYEPYEAQCVDAWIAAGNST